MGTSLNNDTNRIIAKRVILTGHPFKVHKKTSTVRYMFFNKGKCSYHCLFIPAPYTLQRTYCTSSPSSCIRNMGALDTFASLLVLMDTLRLISTARSIRWIQYACRFINACFRNGLSCGRSLVRIRMMIWKIDQSRTKLEIVEILSLSRLQKFKLPKSFMRDT